MAALFNKVYKFFTDGFIHEHDSFSTMVRKLSVVVFSLSTPFGFFSIWYFILAANRDENDPMRNTLLAIGISWLLWSLLVDLPVVIYCQVVTKTVPDFAINYLMLGTTALMATLGGLMKEETFQSRVNFFASMTVIVASNTNLSIPIAVLIMLLMLLEDIRDSFEIQLTRIENPWPGYPVERMLYTVPKLLTCVIVTFVIYTMAKTSDSLIRSADKTVEVANDITSYLLDYDTDKAEETLKVAMEDEVIDADTGATAPSPVNRKLAQALSSVIGNYKLYRPHLPEYVLNQASASRDSENQDGDLQWNTIDGSDHDDDDEENIKKNNSNKRRKSSTPGHHHALDMSGSSQHSGTSHNSGARGSNNKNGSSSNLFQQRAKRSWEVDNDYELHHNNNNNNKGETGNKKKTQIGYSLVVSGNTIERIVLANIDISRFPEVLAAVSSHPNASVKLPPKETASRLNRMLQLILDEAGSQDAFIHNMTGDSAFISWNATTRCAHADGKACRFFTAVEKSLRKEIRVWAQSAHEEKTRALQQGASNNNSTNAHVPLIHQHSSAANSVDSEKEEQQQVDQLHQQPNDNNNSHGSGTSLPRTNSRKMFSRRASRKTATSSDGGDEDDQHNSSSTVDGSSSLELFFQSLFKNRSLISGGLVNGSAFCMLGGSDKKKQFILINFSQADYLQHVAQIGRQSHFVAVCRTIHQNTNHEFIFRGAGVHLLNGYSKLNKNTKNSNVATTPTPSAALPGQNEADIVEVDGNLASIAAQQQQQQQPQSPSATRGGGALAQVVASPIYELVAPKELKSAGGDDEWLYLIAGKSSNTNLGSKSPQQQPQHQGIGRQAAVAANNNNNTNQQQQVCVDTLLNEAVLELARNQTDRVQEILNIIYREDPTCGAQLPAVAALEQSLNAMR